MSRPQWVALFPGQGSQAVGMGRDVADRWPEAREVFEIADDVLGEPISRLCFEGPDDALQLTRNTQPALLTVSVAAWRVLSARVPAPAAAAGHSLGEYSALVAAGVLRFEDAVRAVRLRGDAMQDAVPVGEGGMAAVIGPEPPEVDAMCARIREADEVLVAANFNAPGQTVVAGHAEAVARLAERGAELGAKRIVPLPVSAPFHSPLMEPAARRLGDHLAGIAFGRASFPVYANVDAAPCAGGDDARERLVAQVSAPVRWVETMRRIERDTGAESAIEIGAGRVLAGLSRRINQTLKVRAGGTAESLDQALGVLSGAGEAG